MQSETHPNSASLSRRGRGASEHAIIMQSHAIRDSPKFGIPFSSRPRSFRASSTHLMMREAISSTQTQSDSHQTPSDRRRQVGRELGREIIRRWSGDALFRVCPAGFGLQMELGMLDGLDGERRGGPWVAAVELGADRCEAVKVGELPVHFLALEVQRGHLRVLRERG